MLGNSTAIGNRPAHNYLQDEERPFVGSRVPAPELWVNRDRSTDRAGFGQTQLSEGLST
jgi:hypothetical protein